MFQWQWFQLQQCVPVTAVSSNKITSDVWGKDYWGREGLEEHRELFMKEDLPTCDVWRKDYWGGSALDSMWGCSRRRIRPVVMFGGRTTDVRSALENIWEMFMKEDSTTCGDCDFTAVKRGKLKSHKSCSWRRIRPLVIFGGRTTDVESALESMWELFNVVMVISQQ